MKTLSNFLIISGEGRNVGKTILACNIISKFSKDYKIIGLKLAPYIHENVGNAEVVIVNEDLVLYEETEHYTRKDSSRMLAAGAHKAYLLQMSDEKLRKGFETFLRHISCQTEVIQKQMPEPGTTRIVNFSINSFDINLDSIHIEHKKWKLIET